MHAYETGFASESSFDSSSHTSFLSEFLSIAQTAAQGAGTNDAVKSTSQSSTIDRAETLYLGLSHSPLQQKNAVADGILQALKSTDATTSEQVTNQYLEQASLADLNRHIETLCRWAACGNENAITVLATITSRPGDQSTVDGKARTTLESLANDDNARPAIVKALLDVSHERGDSDRLLATLGNVAQKGGEPSQQVRDALYKGLQSPTDSKEGRREQASAVAGMMAFCDRWTGTDAKIFGKNLSSASISALNENTELIGVETQKEILTIARQKLESTDVSLDAEETKRALEVVSTFAAHAGISELRTLSRFASKDLAQVTQLAPEGQLDPVQKLVLKKQQLDPVAQQLAAGTLLRVGQSAADKFVANSAWNRFAFQSWGPLVPEQEKSAMLAYAKDDAVAATARNSSGIVSQSLERVAYVGRLQPPTSFLNDLVKSVSTAAVVGSGAGEAATTRDVTGSFPLLNLNQNRQSLELSRQSLEQTATKAHSTDHTSESATFTTLAPEEQARELDARLILLNSMTPALRKEFTGVESLIDIAEARKQLKDGTLQNGPYAFLLVDVSKALSGLRQAAQDSQNDVRREIEHLNDRKEDTSEDLNEHTSKGLSLLDRACFWDNNEAKFDDRQSKLVRKVQRLEKDIKEQQKTLEGLDGRTQLLELYGEIDAHTKLMQKGKIKEADQKAMEMWGKNGELLKQLAPTVWRELEGPGTNGSNAFQRLAASGETHNNTIPKLGEGTADGLKAGLAQLVESGDPALKDTGAVHKRALAAVDSDPTLGALARQTRVLGTELQTLQDMVKSATEGTKFDTFVEDTRDRAKKVKEAMAAVEPQLPEIKKQLDELKKAQEQTTDETTKEELKKRIEGFEEALKLFDPESDTNKQLKKMLELVDSPKFDSDTFWNWLKKEGAVLGAAIGCAVAAGIAVGTAGIGSPLLALAASAVASSAAGLAGQELAKELYFNNPDWGLGNGDRSQVGQCLDGETIVDASTGQERKMEWTDVVCSYGTKWAIDSTLMVATMGAGNLLGKGANAMLAKMGETQAMQFLSRNADTLRQMVSRSNKVEEAIASNGHQSWQREFVKEFADETFDEVKEEVTEDTLQQTLGKGNAYLGFAASVLLAAGKNTRVELLKGPEVTKITAPTANDVNTIVAQLRKDGYNVDGTSPPFKVNLEGRRVELTVASLPDAVTDGNSGGNDSNSGVKDSPDNRAPSTEQNQPSEVSSGERNRTLSPLEQSIARRWSKLEDTLKQAGTDAQEKLLEPASMQEFLRMYQNSVDIDVTLIQRYNQAQFDLLDASGDYEYSVSAKARTILEESGQPETDENVTLTVKTIKSELELAPDKYPELVRKKAYVDEMKAKQREVLEQRSLALQKAAEQLQTVTDEFTSFLGLPPAQVNLRPKVSMNNAGASYNVGSGKLNLVYESVNNIAVSSDMQRNVYHELVHHSQTVIVIRALKQKLEASLPANLHRRETLVGLLRGEFQKATGSPLDLDFCQKVLDVPYAKLTPAELKRADAMARSFKDNEAQRALNEVNSDINVVKDYRRKVSTENDDVVSELLREIKSNQVLRRRLFDVDEVEQLPEPLQVSIRTLGDPQAYNPSKARGRMQIYLDDRLKALDEQHAERHQPYQDQLCEQEAFIAHESIELAMRERSAQTKAA